MLLVIGLLLTNYSEIFSLLRILGIRLTFLDYNIYVDVSPNIMSSGLELDWKLYNDRSNYLSRSKTFKPYN